METMMTRSKAKRQRLATDHSPIPGLPIELAMECISRVTFPFHPDISLVSRSWRAALRSPDLAAAQRRACTTRNVLCFCTNMFSEDSHWILYDPTVSGRHSFFRLPPPPVKVTLPACISIGSLLFLLGGESRDTPSHTVQIYDARANQWRLGPPMLAARKDANAGAIDGRIYVTGGCNSPSVPQGEIIDLQSGTWKPWDTSPAVRDEWRLRRSLAMEDFGNWGNPFSPHRDSWENSVAAVNGAIYYYSGIGELIEIKSGVDPATKKRREILVKGYLPRTSAGAIVRDFGGLLCVVYPPRGCNMRTLCVAIKVEEKDEGLRGEIMWKRWIHIQWRLRYVSMFRCVCLSI